MPFTPTGTSNILQQLTGKISSVLPTAATCYIGLSTATPNADGSGFTEPNKNGYARVLIGIYNQSSSQVMDTPTFSSGTGSITNGSKSIFFPLVTNTDDNNGWGTVTHFGLFNAATGGTLILWGALNSSVTCEKDFVPLFNIGNFTLNLS